jgi:chemotaxis protein methyltransferase CheR
MMNSTHNSGDHTNRPVSMGTAEFRSIRNYIEKHCGIVVTEEKQYLIETRLTTLMVENGCRSFSELHTRAVADKTNILRDKIIDAMTTNETLWFRDQHPFTILEKVMLPAMTEQIREKKRTRIRIWSAACATGQEPYSIAMTVLEFCRKHHGLHHSQVEITGTDISSTVLFLATSGRYDNQVISRGLPAGLRDRYFHHDKSVWVIDDSVKSMVTFRRQNLQDDFFSGGRLDIVFCRNVLIYFSDSFKRDILARMARLLQPEGFLFVGSSESLIPYTNEYKMVNYEKGLYYQIKPSHPATLTSVKDTA